MIRWVIIEDDVDRSKLLIEAIGKQQPNDEIVLYFANRYIDLNGQDELPPHHNLRIQQVRNKEDFSKVIEEDGKLIFLLDIILSGINEETLTNPNNIILPVMERAFEKENSQRIITITSAQSHPIRQKNAFQEKYQKRILAGLWDLDSGDMEVKQEIAAKIIANSLRKWEAVYGEPVKTFFSAMSEYSIQDCHINDRLIKAPTDKEEILAPLLHLSNFLGYDFNKFMRDFEILDNFGDYVYPNAFEECLKQMGNKNAPSISLMGLILVAWAAYRRIPGFEENEGNQLFFNLIKENIDGQFRALKRTKGGEGEMRQLSDLKRVIRYSSVIAPQGPEALLLTMKKLYEMFKYLFINESSGESTVQKLNLEMEYPSFSIYLNIDGDNLVQTLNTVFASILKGESMPPGHQASRKIIDYWLQSNYSSYANEKNGLTETANTQSWSHRGSFSIESRNSNSRKGATLLYTV